MGAVASSSNVQAQPGRNVPAAPNDKGATDFPEDIADAASRVFLTRDSGLLRALRHYYELPQNRKTQALPAIYQKMMQVHFSPPGGAHGTIESHYGEPTVGGIIQAHNTLLLREKISAGAFGEVWNARINDRPIVIKVALAREQRALLEEAVMSILFSSPRMRKCFEHYASTLGVVGIDAYPFVQPGFAVRNSSISKGQIIIGYEAFSGTVAEFVHNPALGCTDADLADIVAQLLQILMVAQEAFGFMHKDLKVNNVMLMSRSQRRVVWRSVRGGHRKRPFMSRFTVHLIDFGLSCANFAGCGVPLFLENYNPVFQQADIRCANASHDLMMFLISIIPLVGQLVARSPDSERFGAWWNAFLQPVEHLANQAGIRSVDADTFRQFYRDDIISRLQSSTVRPESMFERLMQISEQFAIGQHQSQPALAPAPDGFGGMRKLRVMKSVGLPASGRGVARWRQYMSAQR